MPDTTDDSKQDPAGSASGPLQVHFNPVMREPTTKEILVTQIDPALRRRRRILMALVAVVFVVLVVMSILNNTDLLNPPPERGGFGPGGMQENFGR